MVSDVIFTNIFENILTKRAILNIETKKLIYTVQTTRPSKLPNKGQNV
jgi:hypothetical protein